MYVILHVVVTVHRLSCLCPVVVLRTVADVNELVAARMFAVVQLSPPTTPRYDHHADDDDDRSTQQRAAQQCRHQQRVEHQTSGRQATMKNRAKMVLGGRVPVDDRCAQSDAGRQRSSTGVCRYDGHYVRGVHVGRRQRCH